MYGGYFGAGIGILMIAAWSALGMSNIHGVNGLRSLLGTAINGIALLLFVVNHSVEWAPGLLMAVTAVLTGYFGAAYARKLPPIFIRQLRSDHRVEHDGVFFLEVLRLVIAAASLRKQVRRTARSKGRAKLSPVEMQTGRAARRPPQ